MTVILLEFVRPDGTLLRYLDAGFDYLDAAEIPLANAERPLRVTTKSTLFAEAIPLPDGEQTEVRIAAKALALNSASTLRTRVIIDGVEHELVLKISAELLHPKGAAPPSLLVPSPPAVEPPPAIAPVASAAAENCPRCGATLIEKQITLGARFRKFLACSGYPICRFTRELPRP